MMRSDATSLLDPRMDSEESKGQLGKDSDEFKGEWPMTPPLRMEARQEEPALMVSLHWAAPHGDGDAPHVNSAAVRRQSRWRMVPHWQARLGLA